MHQAGLKLQSALTRILGVLEKASGDTRAYGERLDAFSAELDGEKSVEDLRAVVDGLISETHRVVAQNQKLQEKLQQSSGEIVELRRNLAVVQHEAMTDALTGIANRKYFDAQLRAAARDAIQTGETLSLLLIDIDHFKRFNDTYGHQLGDKVLRLVARTLTECVKGRDLTARFGGEEFAILLKKTRLEDAVAVADQIRAMMVRRKIVRRDSGDNLGVVTVSIGAAAYRPGEPVASMLRRADSALYFAKHNGRNRVASESEGGLKVIFASA
jgi:diguanylate cyclase